MDEQNRWREKINSGLLLLLFGVSLGLWIVLAKLIVPSVIDKAYHGQSISMLNNIIEGQNVHPVSHYLDKWANIAVIALRIWLSLCGFYVLVLIIKSEEFFRRFVGEATPGSLGAIRMLTCSILLTNTLWEDLASSALLPPALRQPMGIMQFFYAAPMGFEQFTASMMGLRVFQWLTIVILLMGAIGWHTRFVIPLGAFCYLVLGGIFRQYSHLFHTGLVPLYLMVVLALTPCGDGWSVDRLLKLSHSAPTISSDRTSAVYGWCRYACWVVIALCYFVAGLSKLGNGGLFWWNATSIRGILYADTLKPLEFNSRLSLTSHLTATPDLFFTLLGGAALLGELFFGLVLFFRAARLLFPVLLLMMHIGTFLLQNVLFFDLIFVQLMFFDWTKIRKAVAARLASNHGRIQVLFDGFCPLCRRTVRLLSSFDLLERLELLDFRLLDLNGYNQRHGFQLKKAQLEDEMYVISRGRAYSGFYGYRALALALPLFYPVAPLLFLPGISSLGASVYGYVARNRRRILTCDSECPVEPLGEGSTSTEVKLTNVSHGFRLPLLVSILVFTALLCWFHRLEFYPLTAWQMYSGTDLSREIFYYKVLAHSESGATFRAPIEDAIGAMAGGRFLDVIPMCFMPKKISTCEEFLIASARSYNNGARHGEKIRRFDIQKWKWDFGTNPTDPEYGNVIASFVFDVEHLH